MEKLIKIAKPTIPFGAEEPSWQEVNNFLKKARGKSALGPNGIPHKVYKLSIALVQAGHEAGAPEPMGPRGQWPPHFSSGGKTNKQKKKHW
ncbi:hypothetical protein N1851_025637 [Merluccius polli]|uniref:Uncharacterized protein n=1 Tax=Merluccius polli TaxID=89951 RepID=A0AA47NUS0_MERPO|nr:hypothetical protein N1851_025637 [Merluccius polli]